MVSLLLVVVGLLWAVRAATRALCPPVVPIVDGAWAVARRWLGRLARALWASLWTKPARAYGVATTLWLWSLVLAAISSVGALLEPSGQALAGSLSWWGIVAGGWFLVWLRARRRFRPRPLPGRYERR